MCSDNPYTPIEGSDDVCTLQSALRSCCPDLLLDVLLDTEAGWGISYKDIGPKAKESLLEKLASTIALMLSVGEKGRSMHASQSGFLQDLERNPPHRSGRDLALLNKVIVPFEMFEVSNDGRSFIRKLDARIVDCSKLEDALRVISDIGGKIHPPSEGRQHPLSDNAADPFEMILETGLLEDICVLENEPWSLAMQRKIWLPRTYCKRERYCILANVFWAMTYNGFFGDAAEKILGKQFVVPVSKETLDSFDDEYMERLFEIASLMNYNGWVDSIESLARFCIAA